jgi:hypothetical protein
MVPITAFMMPSDNLSKGSVCGELGAEIVACPISSNREHVGRHLPTPDMPAQQNLFGIEAIIEHLTLQKLMRSSIKPLLKIRRKL